MIVSNILIISDYLEGIISYLNKQNHPIVFLTNLGSTLF